jgi:hypothetical protein
MARRVEVVEDLLREARSVPLLVRPIVGLVPDETHWFAETVRFALDHPDAIRRLHLATAGLPLRPTLERALPVLLDRGMWLLDADLGAVQVLDGPSGALRLIAHAGFDDDFVERFAIVDQGLAAFTRVAEGGRAVVADVHTHPAFAPYRSMAARYGFRAVQATPLRDYTGRTVGMLSTLWRRPVRPTQRDLRVFALYATFAGERVATLLAGRTRPDRDAPPGRVARAMLDALLDPAGMGKDDVSGPDGARPDRETRAGPFAQALRTGDGMASLADLVVTHVFAAELELDAARSLTDEEHVEARIAAATTTLERLVVQLRAAMLAGDLSEDVSEEDEGPTTR